jgi:hypothetical protein
MSVEAGRENLMSSIALQASSKIRTFPIQTYRHTENVALPFSKLGSRKHARCGQPWYRFASDRKVLPKLIREGVLVAARPIDKLILCYNADAGKISALFGSARKMFALGGCRLVALTHNLAGERHDWAASKSSYHVPIEYAYKDELGGDLGTLVRERLPAVVAVCGREYLLLLDSKDVAGLGGTVAALNGEIRTRATRQGLAFPSPR